MVATEEGEPGREESLVSPVILSEKRVKYWKVSFSILFKRTRSSVEGSNAGSGTGEREKAKESASKKQIRRLNISAGLDGREFFFDLRDSLGRVLFLGSSFEVREQMVRFLHRLVELLRDGVAFIQLS